MGSNVVDEIDCGIFFDQIDDLIEFSPDNDCQFACFDERKDAPGTQNDDSLLESTSLFSAVHSNSQSELSAQLSVPYEDIVQLEWLSTFMEDPFPGGEMTLGKESLCVNKEVNDKQFETSSPVSVLERSSSNSSNSSSNSLSGDRRTRLQSPTQRARSKRPRRPATFSPRTAIQLVSSFGEIARPFSAPQDCSGSLTGLAALPVRPSGTEPKKKKRKMKTPLAMSTQDAAHHYSTPAVEVEVRKCKHCEITKTPQWRAGPTGPKTLCNACGVRYKSGRLFPEYRPAASPTFVPSVHSNSHKKVLEMRTSSKVVSEPAESITPATNNS